MDTPALQFPIMDEALSEPTQPDIVDANAAEYSVWKGTKGAGNHVTGPIRGMPKAYPSCPQLRGLGGLATHA